MGSGLTPGERKDGQEAIPGRWQVPCKVRVQRGALLIPGTRRRQVCWSSETQNEACRGQGAPHNGVSKITSLGGGDSWGSSLDQKMLAPCASSFTRGPFLHPPWSACLPSTGAVSSMTAATRRRSRLAADPRPSATSGSVSIRASCAVSPQQGRTALPQRPRASSWLQELTPFPSPAGITLLPPPRGLSTLSDL